MLKKLVAILLAAAMLLALVACGANQETADTQTDAAAQTSTDAAAQTGADAAETSNLYQGSLEPVKVGFICWGYTDSLAQSYVRALDYAAQYCGFEVEYATFATIEDIITNVENLIQSGCKIILSGIVSATAMELCEKNEVYLAQFGSPITDPELSEYVSQCKYWVGCSTVDDYDAGYQCVEALYEQGCRNIVLMGQAAGNTCQDLRIQGAREAAATHADLNVIGEYLRNDSTAAEWISALQNYIALYPELDGFTTTAATSGALEGLIQVLDTEGRIGEIKYATIDIQDGTGDYMNEGALSFIAGGQYLETMFLTLNAINIYDGAYEGNTQISTKFIYLTSADDYDMYVKYIDADGVYPFSPEELQSITWRCNENATFEDLYNMWNNYSLETIVEKNG